MKTSLSPLDQTNINIWEILQKDLKTPKWKIVAFLVLFGNLTLKSKLSKKEKIDDPFYIFDLEITINKLTKLFEDSNELSKIWMQNRIKIIYSLKI